MTLGTTHSLVSYDGDGSTTVFAVTFEFHATTDLEVIVITELTGAESLKSLGADYSVSGGNGTTGTVTMTVAPTAAERLLIRRVSSDVQPDDLIDGGGLPADPLERRLDILTALVQELETDVARSLKVAKGSEAPESGLTLNLTGAMGSSLQVATDELGIIPATGTVPDNVVTSAFGEGFVGLADATAARANLGLADAAITALGTSGATIPLLNGNNTYSGTATFSADATLNSDLIVNAPLVLISETLTIDTGAVTPTKSNLFINNEGAASADNLDTIAVTNHPVGAVIKIKAKTSGQVPTLRHASGNIYLDKNQDAALDDLDKSVWLERREAVDGEHAAGWYEVGRSERIPSTAVLPHVIDDTLISSAVAEHDAFWDNADGWLWVEVLVRGIVPAADAVLDLFLSANGSTFESGVSDYAWVANITRNGSGTETDTSDASVQLSTSFLLEATTSGRSVFDLKIPFPGDTASNPPVKLSGTYFDSLGTYFTVDGAGFRLTDQAVRGVRLKFQGQNIASGHILTIGYK